MKPVVHASQFSVLRSCSSSSRAAERTRWLVQPNQLTENTGPKLNTNRERRTQKCERLDSLEVLLHLSPRQPQHHWPAVRADGRIGGLLQLLEDVRHLL